MARPDHLTPGGLRAGVIGAGRWGRVHIATLRRLEGFRLVAVASANPATAGLVPPGCEVWTDWRAMVASAGTDVVIIATPPALHVEMACFALTHGKPVFLEKPMTLDPGEAHRIASLSRRLRLPVMVDHIHLFSDAFRALCAHLPDIGGAHRLRGEAGNRGPIRTDADVLWDWGPHDLSLCVALGGAAPEHLAVEQVRAETTPEDTGQHIRVHMRYAGGPDCRFDISNIYPDKRRRFMVEGPLGRLIYDDLAAEKLMLERAGAPPEAVALPGRPALDNALSAFHRAVTTGLDETRSLDSGVAVVELLGRCAALLNRPGAAG